MIRSAGDRKLEVRENMRGGTGPVTFRHFFEKDEITARCRLCAELTIPPGAGIGKHDHVTEDEVYIVTRGAGILDDGRTKTRIRAGDSVLTGRGESHAISNDGNEDLHLIAVIMCY
jgi:mannose-6-phosphate isomerase-like protein (cupin superfamily)